VSQNVVWTQWEDLDVPEGFIVLHPGNAPLDSSGIEPVTFYVPPYMSGPEGLEAVSRMPNLRTLQLANAGFDDAVVLARPGLNICNARGVHDISTAELALALMLASNRRIDEFVRNQADHAWAPGTYPTLWQSKVAIVGFGSIGKTIAALLAPFDAEVTGFNRSGVGASAIESLRGRLGEFDVVVLILPATQDSVGMVDKDFLAGMKDGSLLVNVARGPIVVTEDLIAELASGRIRAAVDVTDPEPLPPGHPLWQAGNIIISPHVGGNSTAFEPRMRALVASQLQRLARGQALDHVVIPG
jgi:phosphoglycerate dehydrogenase-like enzyme